MKENAVLQALERKAFRSTFQDGLLEILLGLIFLAAGVGSVLPLMGVSRHWISVVVLALPLAYVIGKKRITVPRMGTVKFGAGRKAYKKRILIIMLLFQVAIWIVYIMSVSHQMPGQHLAGLGLYMKRLLTGTMIFFLPLSLLAFFLNMPRLYLLAVMAALGESVYDYLPAPLNGLLTSGVTGLVFVIIGAILLVRFLNRYPLPAQGE